MIVDKLFKFFGPQFTYLWNSYGNFYVVIIVQMKSNSSYPKDMNFTTVWSYWNTHAQDFLAFLNFRDLTLHYKTIARTLKMGSFLKKV